MSQPLRLEHGGAELGGAESRSYDRERRGPARLALILAVLGAILVGAGTILFLASNWRGIPGWGKLSLDFAGMVAAYYAGFQSRYVTRRYRRTGSALIFLGSILFGSGIFLIAQGMHVNADESYLMLLWAVGMAPLAYLLRSRVILTLVVICLALALWQDILAWMQGIEDIYPLEGVNLAFGTLLYGVGNLHGLSARYRPFRAIYCIAGLLIVLWSLFPSTFGFMQDLVRVEPGSTFAQGLLVRFLGLMALSASAAIATLVASRSPRTYVGESTGLIALLMVAFLLFYVGGGSGRPMVIVFNALVFLVSVGAVAVGALNRENGWINVGVFWLAALMIARYFDWITSLMARSFFALAVGATLLVSALALERWTRRTREQAPAVEGGRRVAA